MCMQHCCPAAIAASDICRVPWLVHGETRLSGFQQALAEAASPRTRDWCGTATSGSKGIRLAKEMLLEHDRQRALRLQRNDGLRALKAIHELGLRCPEDVRSHVRRRAVRRRHPARLTVVAQPPTRWAGGAKLLIARLRAGRPAPSGLPHARSELLVRESTIVRRSEQFPPADAILTNSAIRYRTMVSTSKLVG